jgi:hypothetical protein
MWCVACHWTPPGPSSNHFGLISNSERKLAFWTGSPSWWGLHLMHTDCSRSHLGCRENRWGCAGTLPPFGSSGLVGARRINPCRYFFLFRVQPHVPGRLAAQPWGSVFPALAVSGFFGIRWFMVRGAEVKSFLASCAYISGMLTSAVFGLYPYVLPSKMRLELDGY